MNKVIIDSKELAVGSWVKNNDEIARITSLYNTARKEWLGEGQNRSKCVYASPAGQR